MPKLTPERRAELEAELAADDDDDDSDEVEIGHGDKTFRGSYRRARGVAEAWGIKLQADPPAAKAKTAKDDGGDNKTVRFGRRTG